MPINSITINNHKVPYGQNSTEADKFQSKLYDIIAQQLSPLINLNTIDVYNMNGSKKNYNAGSENRAIIFANNTQEGASGEAVDTEIQMSGHTKTVKLLPPQGDGILLTSENGIVIAEFNKQYNELNILFNIFEVYEVKALQFFKFILNQWYEVYWKAKELEHSWIHSQDKQGLTARFTDRLKQQNERVLREDKHQAQRYEQNIEEYKQKIKSNYDNMIRLRNKIEIDEKNLSNVSTQLIEQLDLIIAHPKVSDLHIKDGKFVLFIPDVYCYDDRGRRYYIGNFRVEIKIENTDVKFFGDNPRRSYWTSRDPHPHVNGNNGSACLGNVASTIAELCARNEIYALALVCIDFLESANTEDPAGRNVGNWQRVKEDGTPFNATGESPIAITWECERCGEGQLDNVARAVAYEYIDDDGEPQNEITVCPTCLDHDYYYDEDVEEYVES